MNLPLSVNYWAYSAEISDAVGERIVDDRGNFSDKDAERIVECVNALAGIDDPAGFIKMQRDHIATQHESLGKSFDRCMELESALLAIVARIQGEWDNPHLVGWGGLSTDHDEDVLNIVNFTMKGVPR